VRIELPGIFAPSAAGGGTSNRRWQSSLARCTLAFTWGVQIAQHLCMKTISILVLVAAACACSGGNGGSSSGGSSGGSGSGSSSGGGTTGSNCPVAGTYDSTVTTQYGGGQAVTSLGADGGATVQVTLQSNGATTTVSGSYSVSGSDITFVNSTASASNGAPIDACTGIPGAYSMTWSTDCNQVTLHKVSDSCPPREQEADGNTLTRR
jgi:hypothetical protein